MLFFISYWHANVKYYNKVIDLNRKYFENREKRLRFRQDDKANEWINKAEQEYKFVKQMLTLNNMLS